MKRYGLFLAFLILAGCSFKPAQDQILAKVNTFAITSADFDKQFRVANFGKEDSSIARRAFLDQIIQQNLILQYAHKKGLDRQPDFLSLIERFWIDSLQRVALEDKIRSIDAAVTISEAEIKAEYDRLLNSGLIREDFEKAYPAIYAGLLRQKEEAALRSWLDALKSDSNIQINEALLNKGL